MDTPVTEKAYIRLEGESDLQHEVRKMVAMQQLEGALRTVVTNSFYGHSTGYQHVAPAAVAAARAVLGLGREQ